ncbi:MAG TPA: AAA family ATPase [Streptosporangiaceae bacterium]
MTPPNRTPFVGRQQSLDTFERALDATMGGSFQFLNLVGEPGVGKTRLLEELAVAAQRRGLCTMSGRATEFEQELPFGVIIDALDDHLEAHSDQLSEDLGPAAVKLLAGVFPGLAHTLSDDHRPDANLSALERYRVHRAIRQLLDELAVPSGLVLLLDDLHWADDGSTELLDHLVRHPPFRPVLIAIAYRPAQAGPRLAAAVENAREHRHEIPVGPLTQAETREFLGTDVDRSYAGILYRASGGVPLFLEALARMGRDAPVARQRGGDTGHDVPSDLAALPAAVRRALQAELTGLSATALLVARAAAVTADEFEPALAAVAAEVPLTVALDALNEAVARDVVRPTAAGRFRFRHPLVRHAAYVSAPAGWRVAAHARVAERLAALGAPATWRAHHVERSGRFGDESAIATLVEAAREVAGRAPVSAGHWLEAALRLAPAGHCERLDLMLELATVRTTSGDAVAGREMARETLRLLAHDDHLRRARAARICALAERRLDRFREAHALIMNELRLMPDPKSEAAATLRLRLASESLLRSRFRAAQAELDLLPDDAPGWPPALSLAIAAMRPMAALAGRRIDAALDYIEIAEQRLDSAPDEHLAAWLEAVAWLSWTELMMGRYREAHRYFDRAITVGRATGQGFIAAMLLAGQARTLTVLGRLAEAAALAEQADEAPHMLGVQERVFVATQRCLVASWSGDDEAALRFGEQAVRAAADFDEWWSAFAHYSRGTALVNGGQVDEGVTELLVACPEIRRSRLDPAGMLSCCEMMVQIEAGRGNRVEARTWADRADRLAHPALVASAAHARLARAHLTRITDAAAAAAAAVEAAGLLEAAGMVIDMGRARMTAGLAYADAGDRDRAGTELQAAAEVFASCGARKLHAQAQREQRRIGARVPGRRGRAYGAGQTGLSKRELEVARLVVAGRTNQQIAELLFLSVRTVESHLSHIFAKLDVTSRVGIVHALTQRDADDL